MLAIPDGNQTEARDLWFFDTRARIRVAAQDGEDGLSVIESTARCGHSPPLHIHRDEDEIFHVMAGSLRFHLDGRELVALPGDTLLAKRNVPHTFRVESAEGASWLTTTRHGSFEAFVRAVARPAEGDALPPPAGPPSSEEQAAVAEIARRFRIDIVGAPLT